MQKTVQKINKNNLKCAQIFLFCLFICLRNLSVLQRPEVQKVNITRQGRAQGLVGAELGQLAVDRGDHGERRVAQGERGQVSEQREVFNGSSSHFLSWKKTSESSAPG